MAGTLRVSGHIAPQETSVKISAPMFIVIYHLQNTWLSSPGHRPISLCRKEHGKRKQSELI